MIPQAQWVLHAPYWHLLDWHIEQHSKGHRRFLHVVQSQDSNGDDNLGNVAEMDEMSRPIMFRKMIFSY